MEAVKAAGSERQAWSEKLAGFFKNKGVNVGQP